MKIRSKLQNVGFTVMLLIVFCGIAGSIGVVHAETYGDFEYSLINDGVEIDKYNGSAMEIKIPNQIDGKKVISIGEKAFFECNSLISIEFPSEVTNIGKSAFEGCEQLIHVSFPEKLESIDVRGFFGCSSLTSIELPPGVTSIGVAAFCNTGIKEATLPLNAYSLIQSGINIKYIFGSPLPEQLKKVKINRTAIISGESFKDCYHLTSIELPEGLTSIESRAFRSCSSLTNIELPEGLENIGEEAFYSCRSLTSIEIPSTVTCIGESAFNYCEKLASVELPSGLTSIEKYAFAHSGLTSIEIPSTVTSIGRFAFYGCESLKNIIIPSSVTEIDKTALHSNSGYSKELTIICEENSYAQNFAIETGLSYVLYCSPGNHVFSEEWSFDETDHWKACSREECTACTAKEDMAEHTWKTVVDKVATVEEEGSQHEECSVCGYKKEATSIPKVEETHKHIGILVQEVEPSCEVDGNIAYYVCECGMYFAEETCETELTQEEIIIKAIGSHVYSTEWIFDGTHHWKECTQEGCTAKEDMAEHTWKTVVDKVATVEEEGSQHEECGVCGYKKEATSIPKVEEIHKHIGILVQAVEPSCEKDGNIAYYMCECGTYFAEEACETELTQEEIIIKAIGNHVYSTEWTSDGIQHWKKCIWEGCTAKEDMAGHTWKTVVDKAATVEEEGSRHEECSVCGYKKEATTISKVIGHLPDNKQEDEVVLAEKGKTITDFNTNSIIKITNPGTIIDSKVIGAEVEYTKPSESSAKVVIPETVTIDGITYKVTSIAPNAFKNDKKITELIIGNNVITLGNGAFCGCTSLKTLIIGENVTTIGAKAFYKCTALREIIIPAKVVTIGDSAFSECKSVTKVTIGKGVKIIGASAFSGCIKLKTVSMGANVTTIGAKAFYKCTALTKITIPAKIRKIGKKAFYGCKKLKKIKIKTTKLTNKTVGSKAFKGIHPKAAIKVPKKKLSSYRKILKKKGMGSKVKIKK